MKEIVIILVGVIVLGSVVFGLAFWARSVSCDEKAISFSEHKWGVFSGCMVFHNGRWLPLDNIRGFDDKG